LREVANFLQHAASSYSDSRVIPFRVKKCLPPALQNLSPRDSFYQNTLNEKCRERLDWILTKESGSFLVAVVASDSHANHVLGVDASRRLTYDHEIRNALPFSQEGFDGACGGSTTCVGLAEIRQVVPISSKKRTRALDSQSGR
jgi:hypothetical protein